MQFQFKEQLFQVQAVRAVVDCFAGQPLSANHFTLERSQELIRKTKAAATGVTTIDFETDVLEAIGYRNSPLNITDAQVLDNIRQVQRRHDLIESTALDGPAGIKLGVNLTIEMETGTGKTYTYIRTMYELHKSYGWSKFIIIVPSVAIREGAFTSFENTQEHFQALYGHKIVPFIYNSAKPQDIENFASDSRISVMIINTQAFNARGKDARRIYMELDQFGSRRPIEIISQTNPILIIDEPQSVEGDKTLESMQDFKPLLTLRYSATHRNEYNKVFRLDALDAYAQKLVKKIQVKGISLKGTTGTSGYLYLEQVILSTNKPPLALIEYEKRSTSGQVRRARERLPQGANLYELSGEMPQYKHVTLTEIDGLLNRIVIGGQELYAGDALGNVDENALRRIQIRETISSHLAKEKVLFQKGIKVLSLFFIDSVEKYRVYRGDEEELGEYAKLFEEEYNNLRSEFLDLFATEYNEFLERTDPGKVKAYMPDDYHRYLERDDAHRVHNGYFSVDKKNKLTDPTVKRGKEDSDDVSAYDLIMKDKKRLLSFEEPTRFIFSHSALKEGWDNPNVFQICALKISDSTIRRRQEVGRGMRLAVNVPEGIRQDFETIGDQVHEVNVLTVVASESYEEFAKGLQSEIAASLKDRPQKAEVAYFVGKLVRNERGAELRLTEELSKKINKYLYKHDIIDEDDKVTPEGREKIEANVVPLPEELADFKQDVVKLLRAIYSEKALLPEDGRKTAPAKLNANFSKKEFQALWEKINIKTIYEVQFDTDKLIRDSKNRINADLYIAERTYEVKTGELRDSTKEEMQAGTAVQVTDRSHSKLNADVYTNTLYDIVGEIVRLTNLTRRTVVEILKAIEPNKFYLLRRNPEEFIAKCGKLISEVKASMIINNIVYHKTEERHDAKTVFTNDKDALRQSELLKKHIYDVLVTDSKVEADFAQAMEASTAVTVYAKLPSGFFITTPVANYNPDWAIVFDKDQVRHIYFVAETKGSDSDMDLREIEKLKIHCAHEHFKAISDGEVKFAKVSSYEGLREILELK